MFERFTDRARRAVVLAQKEARESGAANIHTEHLLLGLLMEGAGRSNEVLTDMGVTEEAVRRLCAVLEGPESRDQIPFTLNAKRALELSLREALQQGEHHIDAEHLLLGLIRFDCGAVRFLESQGVSLPVMRDALTASPAGGTAHAPRADSSRSKKSASKALEAFGTNLVEQAKAGDLDPVVGRDKEIERAIQILCRRTKANPVLVGPPGVGKTAIVEGLAQRIAEGDVPDVLADAELWSIDLGAMVAGTRYRGDFEERIKALMKEASGGNVILFLDEIHSVLGTGSGESGGMGAADILKPALARGEVRLVGATTTDEYRRLEKDKALERRMAPVEVNEPSQDVAVEILQRLRATYEDHHKLVATDDALEAAVKLTVRYLPDRRLPDKAIDALDEAMARARFVGPRGDKEIAVARDVAVASAWKRREGDFSADDKAEETSALDLIESRGSRWDVTAQDIAEVVSQAAGVPILVDESEADKLLHLEDLLHERIIGQDRAVHEVAKALRRTRAGFGGRRMAGSFLFVGPTGVGKTELARSLAELVMGRDDALIQVDMSEYMESHSVARLIGSPPGYVGHSEGGQLTEAVRRNPWSVVLLDEIEKAHPDVLNLLLQLLEEGRLTDSQGRKVDFSNAILIMTSNIGTDLLGRNAVGFGKLDAKADEQVLMDAVRKHLRPELVGRIDEIIAFHSLAWEQVSQIARNMVGQLAGRLLEQGIGLEVTDEAYDVLCQAGFDPRLGARPMRRAVQQLVENRLANALLEGTVKAGQLARLDAIDGELELTAVDILADEPTSVVS